MLESLAPTRETVESKTAQAPQQGRREMVTLRVSNRAVDVGEIRYLMTLPPAEIIKHIESRGIVVLPIEGRLPPSVVADEPVTMRVDPAQRELIRRFSAHAQIGSDMRRGAQYFHPGDRAVVAAGENPERPLADKPVIIFKQGVDKAVLVHEYLHFQLRKGEIDGACIAGAGDSCLQRRVDTFNGMKPYAMEAQERLFQNEGTVKDLMISAKFINYALKLVRDIDGVEADALLLMAENRLGGPRTQREILRSLDGTLKQMKKTLDETKSSAVFNTLPSYENSMANYTDRTLVTETLDLFDQLSRGYLAANGAHKFLSQPTKRLHTRGI